ncbi:hypothetical protein HDU98_004778 [Podochytrium sp. JEL0797]|nr:hypothetical protein HDU98_004778 [Podochytrium sp. JEL0797]
MEHKNAADAGSSFLIPEEAVVVFKQWLYAQLESFPVYIVTLKDADRFWVLEGCTSSCASVSLTSGGGTIERAWYAI